MSALSFSDFIATLTGSLGAVPASGAGIYVREMFVDMPVDIDLAWVDGELALIAGAPRWRWRTDFDREPGHLTLRLGETDL